MKFFIVLFLCLIISNTLLSQETNLVLPVGHADKIRMAIFSPDGKYMVSASDDQTAKIWEVSSGRLLHTLIGHKDKVVSVSYDHRGKTIITSSFDHTIKKWDAKTGDLLQTIYGTSPFNNAVFDPGDTIILASCWNNVAQLFDCKSGKLMSLITGHEKNVSTAYYSTSGKNIVTASWDGNIKIRERNGICIKTIKCGVSVTSAVFSQDEKSLLVLCFDGRLLIADARSGDILKYIETHSYDVKSAKFSPDRKRIVTTQDDKVIVWDIETGTQEAILSEDQYSVRTACFSTDGKTILSSNDDFGLNVYDLKTKKMISHTNASLSKFNSAVFSSTGRYLLTASDDHTAKLWDTKTGRIRCVLTGHQQSVNIAVFSNDDKYVATGSDDNSVRIWDAVSGELLQEFTNSFIEIKRPQIDTIIVKLPAKVNCVNSLAFSPNNKYITAACDSLGKTWDILSGKLVHTLIGHRDAIYSVAYSPDGNTIATASRDRSVRLWDTNGKPLRTVLQHSQPVYSVAFSPDGKSLATGCAGNIVKLWSLNGSLLRNIIPRSDIVYSVCFSPDGKSIAGACSNNDIEVWSSSTGNLIRNLSAHTNDAMYVSYNRNGSKLVTVSADHTLKVWDAFTGQLVYTLIDIDDIDFLFVLPDNYYLGSKNAANKIFFQSDGHLFPFDQFDLSFNRPDKILSAMGNCDKQLIQNYFLAWQKRLQIDGFTDTDLKKVNHLPIIEIVSAISLKTTMQLLPLSIIVNDDSSFLESYSIYINNVPIQYEKISKLKLHSFKKNVILKLSAGKNKIELVCRNTSGIKSLRQDYYINYIAEPPAKKRTYFIGIGVSNYKDTTYNLKYSVKDIRDLSNTFSKFLTGCIVDTFIDNKVTENAINIIRQKLMRTNIDDQVILAICGHGLLDSSKDFYYATYDCDFNNPALRGLSYTRLVGLLDNIPARKKVIFLDACHSGEVDKSNELLKKGKDIQGKRGAILVASNEEMQNTFDLMQDLFNNLTLGNGAVVVSGSRGTETAQEGGKLENGWFSYSLIEAFGTDKADINQNGKISVEEVKKYVNKRVAEISGDKQTPTVRQDLLDCDWEF